MVSVVTWLLLLLFFWVYVWKFCFMCDLETLGSEFHSPVFQNTHCNIALMKVMFGYFVNRDILTSCLVQWTCVTGREQYHCGTRNWPEERTQQLLLFTPHFMLAYFMFLPGFIWCIDRKHKPVWAWLHLNTGIILFSSVWDRRRCDEALYVSLSPARTVCALCSVW